MKRPLRCRVGWHKYVVVQESPDAGRYHRCVRCGKTWDIDMTPVIVPGNLT